jgi:hypothetical protein
MVAKKEPSVKGEAQVTYCEGGCDDALKLSLEISKEKIVGVSIKPGKTSCDMVKKHSLALEKHILGKHVGDAYKVTSEQLEGKSIPHHGAELVVHALREAILAYESDKTSTSLRDALGMLQSYDEGLPPRVPETDYEF